MADNVEEQTKETNSETIETENKEVTKENEVDSTEPANEEVEQIINSNDTKLVQEEVPIVEESVASKEDTKVELAGIDITPVTQYHPIRIKKVECNNSKIWCEGIESPFTFTVVTKGGEKGDILNLVFTANQSVKNIKLDGKQLTGDSNTFMIDFSVIGYHYSAVHQVVTSNGDHDDVVKIIITNDPETVKDATIVS